MKLKILFCHHERWGTKTLMKEILMLQTSKLNCHAYIARFSSIHSVNLFGFSAAAILGNAIENWEGSYVRPRIRAFVPRRKNRATQ